MGLLLGILITIIVIYLLFRKREASSKDTDVERVNTHSRNETADGQQPGPQNGPKMAQVPSQSEDPNIFQNAFQFRKDLEDANMDVIEEKDVEGVQLDENNLTIMPESPSSEHETTKGVEIIYNKSPSEEQKQNHLK